MTKTEIKYLFLITVIFIAACIETDIYLPAFLDMMHFFSVSESAIQGLLTWNFVGICLSGPLYGPVADAVGRKKPLLAALALFLIGSLVTLFSQTINQMLLGRIFQGLGSGGCFTLGTAIIFDAFQKERAVKAINKLNTVIPVIMAGAPLLGGYLNYTFGFRSNFFLIVLFVCSSFLVALFQFDETLPVEKRNPFKIRRILADFRTALTNLPFWQLTLISSLLFSGYITFLSTTALLFPIEFGVSKRAFPLFQGTILGAWVCASLLFGRMMARWGVERVKQRGLILCVAGGLIVPLAILAAPRNPYLMTSGMLLYALGGNWVFSVYFTEAMAILPGIKGIVASILTSARLMICALIVGAAGAVYNATAYPLALVIGSASVAMLLLASLYERRRKSEVTPTSSDPAGH